MHEMSLCESLLQIVEEQASEQSFTRVQQIWLEVGALAGVEIDALKFCFDVVCRDSIAENCKLNIIHRPGQAKCFGCGHIVIIEHRHDLCTQCSGAQLIVNDGEQFRIKEMEVA